MFRNFLLFCRGSVTCVEAVDNLLGDVKGIVGKENVVAHAAQNKVELLLGIVCFEERVDRVVQGDVVLL